MTIAEALAHGVPVITTKSTPWELVEVVGCGLRIDSNAASLADAIARATRMPLATMGGRGRPGSPGSSASLRTAQEYSNGCRWFDRTCHECPTPGSPAQRLVSGARESPRSTELFVPFGPILTHSACGRRPRISRPLRRALPGLAIRDKRWRRIQVTVRPAGRFPALGALRTDSCGLHGASYGWSHLGRHPGSVTGGVAGYSE